MGVAIPQVVTEDRASGAQVVDGSLKFDRTKTQYLTRDPNGTAGNSNTFTISFWYKRTKPGSTDYHFFSAGDTSTNRMLCEHGGTDNLSFTRVNSSVDANRTTSRVFRDYSGWQHIVFAVDTTLSTASDRIKVYVNGVRETDFSSSSDPTQSTSFYWNADVVHSIGTRSYSLTSNPFDGHFAQWYNIDGQALGPGYFGYTDPLTETWRPKKFKAEGTTVNDGRTWSSTTNGNFNTGASRGADKAFDGNVGGTVYAQANTGTTATVSNLGITGIRSIRVNIAKNNTGDNWGTFALDSTDLTSWLQTNYPSQGNTGTWIDVTSQFTSSTLDSISITTQSNNTDDIRLAGVEINGTILLDGVTQNLSYGTNGFYLPMDGNSPIGEDKSGNGNNWTPINFGGSNTLEKATGALPILNTDGGGKTARPGVFGSEVGAYYAVTVPSGIGGGYYLDGTQKPALSLIRGATYTFDQSDSSNSSHPLVFGTTADGNDYSDGVTTNGTPGSAGAYTKITVPHNAPDTLYYHCSAHGGMGSSTSQTTDTKKADPYAWKNVLGLPLVDITTDVSNLVNSGTTAKTVTQTGSSSDIAASTAQSNFYGSSARFNGNVARLEISGGGGTDGDYDFGTGDFTMECWFYPTGLVNTNNRIFCSRGDRGNYQLMVGSNGYLQFDIGGTNYTSANSLIAANTQWYHLAVTRQSGTLRLFINGIIVKEQASVTADLDETTGIDIGYETGFSSYINGHMQDARVYKGVAKYTSNFIPASTNPDILPDTPSGVSGSSKLTKITDGAVHFDGTDDKLVIAKEGFTTISSSDPFTIEAFVYFNNLNNYSTIMASSTASSSAGGFKFEIYTSLLRFVGDVSSSSTYVDIYDGPTLSRGRWYHLAVSRDGSGNVRTFVDGQIAGTDSTNTGFSITWPYDVTLGTKSNDSEDFNGFISNARIIDGTALYTSNFTPPTRALTNVTNTTLLCCQSTTSATAAAVAPGSITANGNAAATNFNPFTTDINAVRGQETGYATLNPLRLGQNVTLSNGNLRYTSPSGANGVAMSTIPMTSGKYYCEFTVISIGNGEIGICNKDVNLNTYLGGDANGWMYYSGNGSKFNGGTSTNYGASWTNGDVISIVFDADIRELTFYKNGVSQGVAFTGMAAGEYYFAIGANNQAGEFNFGQKPFKFPPPEGFQPLNAANVRPSTVIARPDQYVDIVTYTGDASTFLFLINN